MRPITCREADELRPTLRPFSSITNWIDGEVLNPNRPPITATTWGHRDTDVEVMREEIDANGCRHWLIDRQPVTRWNFRMSEASDDGLPGQTYRHEKEGKA